MNIQRKKKPHVISDWTVLVGKQAATFPAISWKKAFFQNAPRLCHFNIAHSCYMIILHNIYPFLSFTYLVEGSQVTDNLVTVFEVSLLKILPTTGITI